MPRRVLVISDLHIGGSSVPMLGRPDLLASFLERLAAQAAAWRRSGEVVELVINGDFVDFLAESTHPWIPDPVSAVDRLMVEMGRFASVFRGLEEVTKAGVLLTILLGNHDIELAYPQVRDALIRGIHADADTCRFVLGNEPYSVGEVLIEHGNRYDSWNAIDQDALRRIASCSARGEPPLAAPEACPGTNLVIDVLNKLKPDYHFIDLLKPETKVVPYIVVALEPSLARRWRPLFHGARAYLAQWVSSRPWLKKGFRAGPHQVSGDVVDGLGSAFDPPWGASARMPSDFDRVFADERGRWTREEHEVAGEEAVVTTDSDGVAAIEKGGKGHLLTDERLRKLQVALRTNLEGDRTFDLDSTDGPYRDAARRIAEAARSAEVARVAEAARRLAAVDVRATSVIVMGHTHHAKEITEDGHTYLNTGTWADLMSIEPEALVDSDGGREALRTWLSALGKNDIGAMRKCEPHYAHLLIGDDGRVNRDHPLLRRYFDKGPL